MEDATTFVGDSDVRSIDRDDDLAMAARTDRTAFADLYQRHWLAVFRYVRTRTATDDQAAEITAVTFERALGAIARYRPRGGGALAWLLRIARNAAIDATRRTAMLPLDPERVDGSRSSDPEAEVVDRERLAAVAAAMARLPNIQREALALRYASGLTAREIGVVLGKSEDATQKLMSRALAALREDLQDEC
jgi:RNA polymerase sigma-70 factor (ECF subfamily)